MLINYTTSTQADEQLRNIQSRRYKNNNPITPKFVSATMVLDPTTINVIECAETLLHLAKNAPGHILSEGMADAHKHLVTCVEQMKHSYDAHLREQERAAAQTAKRANPITRIHKIPTGVSGKQFADLTEEQIVAELERRNRLNVTDGDFASGWFSSPADSD